MNINPEKLREAILKLEKAPHDEGSASLSYKTLAAADYFHGGLLVQLTAPNVVITTSTRASKKYDLAEDLDVILLGDYDYGGGNTPLQAHYKKGTLKINFEDQQDHYDVTIEIDASHPHPSIEHATIKGSIKTTLSKQQNF